MKTQTKNLDGTFYAAQASHSLCPGSNPCHSSRRKSANKPPLRFAHFYFSNGVEPIHWWAKGEGAAMEFGPGAQPLRRIREDFSFLRGLYQPTAFVSTSPHLGRMQFAVRRDGQPGPQRHPRGHQLRSGFGATHRQADRGPEPGARHRAE